MKHFLLMIAVVALVGCGGSKEKEEKSAKAKAAAEAKEESAKVIEATIRLHAKKPTGELTKADLEKITRFYLNESQLTDVKGLEKLTNLTRLGLSGNKLTSVKGLEKLTQLEVLTLIGNQLTDVKGLEKLTQLKALDLEGNPDLTKAQIDQLKKALPNCKIYSSNPPLTKEESAKEIEKAIRIELKKPTGELTETDLENVTKLNLAGRQLTDVKGLEKLAKLTRLYLKYNPDLTKAQITELQKALPKCTILNNPKK